MNKDKSFRDTVHGNITIPEVYCDKIIDTINFQRLRRVEQTSARALYPCARHDRFIHSLGVYYIGNKIFENLKKRCIYSYNDAVSNEKWDKIKITYEVACLLHDCGHSPFSHTFERYYDFKEKLKQDLIEIANDENFKNDLISQSDAAPHEKVSAIILLKVFGSVIEDIGGDKLLAVRMIIGCKYQTTTENKSIENCFISLLKGSVIDADRIDYVCRDKWASGYNSINLEVDRLISAMFLNQDSLGSFSVCFDKRALTEINNVLDVKNFQQLWVINHHKVVYDQYLLDKAVDRLAELLCPNEYTGNRSSALAKLFDYKSFINRIQVGDQSLYMPSDDDIIYLLKLYYDDNEYAQEWFARKYKMMPLWKSMAEFVSLFPGYALEDSQRLYYNSCAQIDGFIKSKYINTIDSLALEATPKPKIIGRNDVYFKINDNIFCYTKLNMPSQQFPIKFFFYIFIPVEVHSYKEEIISMLKNSMQS